MPLTFKQLAPYALGLGLAASLAGCTRIRDHKGYIADNTLLATVKPGIDNRTSVQGTLGRPSFTSQFGDETWYYVSRETRSLAFSNPSPTAETVLAVKFDQAGNVASVDRSGLEKVVSIDPSGDKTPTLGRDRSFLGELFGNIGTVGAMGGGSAGSTADNPR